jgi:hypothetical protein
LTLAFGVSAATVGWAVSREPVLSAAAATLRRLDPVGEPFEDAARLGPFAALLAYGIIARAERRARQARYSPPPAPHLARLPGAAVSLVLVQCESFFDARRLSARRCGVRAARRLGMGANTTRAEFAALTGIPEGDLGYDRFNPYHALARAPVASLARGRGRRGGSIFQPTGCRS